MTNQGAQGTYHGPVNIHNYNNVKPPADARERRNRTALLRKVHKNWVAGVLENSLHRAVLIDLGLAYQPDAVAYPWDMVVERPDAAPRPLPPGTPMIDVFDKQGGALLILGAPGAGKTTMLLELARTLIARAQEDETHAIPVVLNLSTWSAQRKPLAEWLVEELNTSYDVPRKVGQAWLDKEQILPLLDGLDEVQPDAHTDCVKAINGYRRAHGMGGAVVCCRTEDYAALAAHLKLGGAVAVQPLSDEQIDRYLAQAGDQLSAVRTLLDEDAELRALAQTPLMLNVMALAYQDTPPAALPAAATPEARRSHLFDTYIEKALKQRGGGNKRYSPEETQHWLSWLVTQMVDNNLTVFYIEQMQPRWLTRGRWLYRLVLGSILGLAVGLVFELVSGIVGGLVGGMVLRIVVGMSNIELEGHISWSWRKAWANTWWQVPLLVLGSGLASWLQVAVGGWSGGMIFALVWALVGGLFFGLLFRLVLVLVLGLVLGLGWGLFFGLVLELTWGLGGGLTLGLIIGLLLVTFRGINAGEINERTQPNEGILRCVQRALVTGMVLGFVGGLILGLISVLVNGLVSALVGVLVNGLVSGLLLGLFFGGLAVIQHYTLRFVLWWQGHLPLNLVPFLDHAAERILLRKVGGGYIFLHRMLLEHLAARTR